MGLDQFAYAYASDGGERELMRWRKHPNLQGFMEEIWEDRGRPVYDKEVEQEVPFDEDKYGGCFGDFNCVPLLLRLEDIDALAECVSQSKLPVTSGFFFGESREEDREMDLEFIKLAREALADGEAVIYNSWW
jgi:hypothetical protein